MNTVELSVYGALALYIHKHAFLSANIIIFRFKDP
jgi:hypothetical protein